MQTEVLPVIGLGWDGTELTVTLNCLDVPLQEPLDGVTVNVWLPTEFQVTLTELPLPDIVPPVALHV